MPKTFTEKIFFLFFMASLMVYGMEVYNTSIIHNNISYDLFKVQLSNFFILVTIVMILQSLIGAPLAKKIAFSIINPTKSNPTIVTLLIQIVTVFIMCPSMSMIATLFFKGFDAQFPLQWAQTTIINFPMALLYQIFIAGPLVRFIFKKVFGKKNEHAIKFTNHN